VDTLPSRIDGQCSLDILLCFSKGYRNALKWYIGGMSIIGLRIGWKILRTISLVVYKSDVGRMLKYDRLISEHENAAERVNNEANSSTIISPPI
jgi:hypothetical protein